MAQSKNGSTAEIQFNHITQQMLMDYETELFARTDPVRGAVNVLVLDVQVAIDTGWIDEPFDGFKSGAWLSEEPDPARIQILKNTVEAINDKYASFVTIDPNG